MKKNCTNKHFKNAYFSRRNALLNFSTIFILFLLLPLFSIGQIRGDININTNSRAVANKLLMGTNQGFNNAEDPAILDFINPISMRFPVGVLSNWYNYETDGLDDYGDDYLDNIIAANPNEQNAKTFKNLINANAKSGYNAMSAYQKKEKPDLLWTYNLLYDSPQRSLDRMVKDRLSGLPVNFVELGNEFFWKDQRSTQLDTPEKYVTRAKLVSQKLRAANANIKLSVPLSFSNTTYNTILAGADESYFDFVSYHRYVELQVKNELPKPQSDYDRIMTARKEYKAGVDEIRKVTSKKLWLSEWSVGTGFQAASFIGMADVYLYLFENQNIYDRANYFVANGKSNTLYRFDGSTSLANLRVTGFGAVLKTVRSVFENSTMLGTDVTYAAQLDGVDMITARAVNKTINGVAQTLIFIVNKGSQSVDLAVKFNGGRFYGDYNHDAMVFTDYGQTREFSKYQNVLTAQSAPSGYVRIPARSINVISEIIGKGGATARIGKSVKESETPEVVEFAVYPNPSKNGLFSINKSGNWEVYNLAGSKVKTGNGISVDLSNMSKGTYILKTSEVSKTIIYQ